MFGLGKLDPKKMQAMMKQLGMKQEEVSAKRVVIESDDKNIVIENPQVSKIVMQGQETFQIMGEAREEPAEDNERIKEEDVNLIMEKTGKTDKEARKALEETGDIANAILKLS